MFNKEAKEEKKTQKENALLEKYGLENIKDPQTMQALRQISTTMTANAFIEAGTILGGKSVDIAVLSFLRNIVEQNFIIIRQLDKLTNEE